MRVAGVIRDSLVNGEGIRDVLFVQGCPHHCKGCHNMNTWSIDGGKKLTTQELVDTFKDSPNNITISGGEPFDQWCEMLDFMYWIRAIHHDKRFWIYTGYKYEQIKWIVENYFLSYVDVIVDGEYIEDMKKPNCLYRGSSNQRLIDVRKTVENGNIVLWEEKDET